MVIRIRYQLNLSVRQINRLIIKYKETGKSGFIHGNNSRKPAKTLDKSISNDIKLLYQNKYYDFNFKHFNGFDEVKEFKQKKIYIFLMSNP